MIAVLAAGGLGVLAIVKLLEFRLGRIFARVGITIVLVLPLLAVVYAVTTTWRHGVQPVDLGLLATFVVVTGLGTSFGYHRLLTHHSFETSAPVKAVALIAGAMAVPSRPIDWAARHLEHHAHADREGDPHSPLDGFVHAHVGWIFEIRPAPRERYCRRLLADRLVLAIDRTAEIWFVLGLAIPVLVDGWRGLLWGGLVRMAFHNQTMFAVNSVCHCVGARPFATRDSSRNNLLVALLSLGEGWHNNHHAFPSMAIHGIGPRQPDATGLLIRLLARLGLVWNVKRPSAARLTRATCADGKIIATPQGDRSF
jgi:stearoyl-CoA desaturase (delta-9 desaturase)